MNDQDVYDAREERDEREAGYRLEDAANRHLIAETIGAAAALDATGHVETALLLRRCRKALEDAARDNAALRAADEKALRHEARLMEERDALAAQVAQAREALGRDVLSEQSVNDAHAILCDLDPSALLAAVRAEAWDAGYSAGWKREREQWFSPGSEMFPAINPHRTEEADR